MGQREPRSVLRAEKGPRRAEMRRRDRKTNERQEGQHEEAFESECGTMYALQPRDERAGEQPAPKDAVAELLGGKYDPDVVEDVRRLR